MPQKIMTQKGKSYKKVLHKILPGVIHLLLALSSAIAMSTLAPGWWISLFLLSLITSGIVESYLKQGDSCAITKR